MRSRLPFLLLSGLLSTEAAPHSFRSLAIRGNSSTSQASLPQNDPNRDARAKEVAIRREGYVYGPSLIGQASPFLNGTLGDERVKQDFALWDIDRKQIEAEIKKDLPAVSAAIGANGGLKTLDDYATILYRDQWKNTITHPASGILTNYTQDLLFSMERLSQNPYALQLLKKTDPLLFPLSDDIVNKVAGTTLKKIHESEALFFADYRYQGKYEKTKKFGALSTAYFYIHPKSKDFLPLAIKTNVGADLTYTPLDSPADWLLAKMMFNVNDLFDSQMYHLIATHDVGEALHEAALRSFSDSHPVMVVLERLMHQAYSARPVGERLCFNVDGHWDENFYISGIGTKQYVTEYWPTAGAFQKNYLVPKLTSQGLIDKHGKSKFKSFPFFSDTQAILKELSTFFASFVDAYYPKDSDISKDFELQNWFTEATTGAKMIDFPSKPSKKVLVEVLMHFEFLNGVLHHAFNSGDPVGSKATLPFHPGGLYAPLPTTKNVTNLIPFLPPVTESLHYITFLATFNRPFYESQNRTLAYAFSDEGMLKRLNKKTGDAAAKYLKSMKKLSGDIRARTFDKNGLCQGMPFCWKALDPGTIPFFFSV